MTLRIVPEWTDADRAEWQASFDEIRESLARIGKDDPFGGGDFWLLAEDWGNREHRLYLDNLLLLRQGLVQRLQKIIEQYPDWTIWLGIMPPSGKPDWPQMGLTIGCDSIVDDLVRSLLPPEIAALKF